VALNPIGQHQFLSDPLRSPGTLIRGRDSYR
jgi:hypothetical protein